MDLAGGGWRLLGGCSFTCMTLGLILALTLVMIIDHLDIFVRIGSDGIRLGTVARDRVMLFRGVEGVYCARVIWRHGRRSRRVGALGGG